DELLAQARDAEYVLDHNGSGDDPRRKWPQDGDDRDEGVTERVPGDHDPRLEAFRPGGPDVVRANGLEHARSREPGDIGRVGQPEGQGRHFDLSPGTGKS